jgi:hypothetical protein
MRATKDDLPVVMDGPGFESRQVVWGDMHVARESCEVPVDLTDACRSLPGGGCPCPHWGYVIRGTITFSYPDEDLVVRAGETYYARPGHLPSAAAGSEIVEFSPAGAYADMLAMVSAVTA